MELSETRLIDAESTIFVAVGKNPKVGGSRSAVEWAIKSFPGKNISLLHVHRPAHFHSFQNFSPDNTNQRQLLEFHQLERQKMHGNLDEYLSLLSQNGVEAQKVWIEMESIEKGIIEIIKQHDIRWLVMGAASDKYYSKNMAELKSRKATFICQHAPVSCHIWFSCKGYLIYTRECKKIETIVENMLPLKLLNSAVETEQPEVTSPISVISRQRYIDCSHAEEDGNEFDTRVIRFTSQPSESKFEGLESSDIYGELPLAMANAKYSELEAFEESVKRWKAEEDAMEALHKAKTLESLCTMERIQRKEMEEELEREKLEVEMAKSQSKEITKELQKIGDQRPILENKVMESSCRVKELEEKIISAVGLLVSLKEKRDQMRIDHENAIDKVNQLKKLRKLPPNACKPQLTGFTFSEIIEATHNFDPSWKIGEGRNGSVYQGVLRHLTVVIKMLPSYGSQDDLEFQHEVELLSRARHPNIVTLIGACPESRALIYEYLQNGNLEDHLSCKHNMPALSWQTRTQIIIEICSALTFIHSSKPGIVHGNLKPSKVLLGANFFSKLSDLSTVGLVQKYKNPTNTTLSVYADPEFVETGELTPESDVYSFGIIILRLITGRPAFGVVNDVKCALEKGNLRLVLDFTAGDLPLEQAQKLACLALKCCEKNPINRPDLSTEVCSVIDSIKKAHVSSTQSMNTKEQQPRVPSHFVCPIYQEVMKDPHIAADGFTYEAEAIEGWLNSGHNTSPMTNLKLSHCNLIPNYALHYAIQEWQQF